MINISDLSWGLPAEKQHEAVLKTEPVTDEDIRCLILPDKHKDCWENCAKILVKLNDDKLVEYLPSILEWFMDLNWPGISIIVNFLNN